MLDPRTLFFAGAVTSAICATMLLASRKVHRPSRAGMMSAAGATACIGAAMLLIALRTIVPDWISIVLGNTMGMVGGVFVYDASRRITGHHPKTKLNAMAILAIVAAQVYLGIDPQHHFHRLMLTSTVQGGFVLASIPMLWRRRRIDPTGPIAWAIGCAAVFALGHVARIVHTSISGISTGSSGLVRGNVTIDLMMLFFSFAPVVFAMSLIGLVNGRIGLELHRIATTDALSGLLNRRAFFTRVARYLERADPTRPLIATMMIDIDHFKTINDRYGHAAGDDVITDLGRILRAVAPADGLTARYGGEEFCLLVRVQTQDDATALAEQIRRTIARRHGNSSAMRIRFTASIGVAVGPVESASVDALMLAADRRVYVAKACGRNRVVSSDEPGARSPQETVQPTLITI